MLCTANQCRSPLAAAMLRRELALVGAPALVISAGLGADGHPATDGTLAAARALDLDLGDHRSRRVARELLAEADLVVGMERLHVREAVVLEPGVWPRTFTLPELARRAAADEPRRPDEDLRAWAGRLSAGRTRQDMMGASDDDDVRDPTNDLGIDHDTVAAMIDELVRGVVSRGWPAGLPHR